MTRRWQIRRVLKWAITAVTAVFLVLAAVNLYLDIRFVSGRLGFRLERGAIFIVRYDPGARFLTALDTVPHPLSEAYSFAFAEPPYRGVARTFQWRVPTHRVVIPLA